jgi:hypothetical protein
MADDTDTKDAPATPQHQTEQRARQVIDDLRAGKVWRTTVDAVLDAATRAKSDAAVSGGRR